MVITTWYSTGGLLSCSLNHRDSVLKRMAPPMELNYSVFGRLPHSDGDAEPLPAAHVGGIRFPRLCYGHAPRTGGFTTRTMYDKVGAEQNVSEDPVCYRPPAKFG